MRKPILSGIHSIIGAACLVCLFAATLPAQQAPAPAGRLPLIEDGPSHRVIFGKPPDPSQAAQLKLEPRFWQQYIRQNQAKLTPSKNAFPGFGKHFRGLRTIERDWAVSLGAGGVAAGVYPAKYTFNVYATPSCTNDYVVFPINASTGNTRAHYVGTFSGEPTAGQSTQVTIQPTGGTEVDLTLTAGATNTGATFAISASNTTEASNLADAINRNLSATALDEVVAVASGATVTVYALTPGNGITLNHADTTLAHFAWGGVTNGNNGNQANIVGFNQLYSGTAGTCGPTNNFTFPEFIFSYASGVGPIPTSPTLSFDGTKIAYVENDPNIGAIFHVLTFSTGSTANEYGGCGGGGNNGTSAPTCATHPVIPGSTMNSTATDYMLPLGLVAANDDTGAAGASSTYSAPFVNYNNDTTSVGDDNGYVYSVTPTFTGTPAFPVGNFPVQLNTTSTSSLAAGSVNSTGSATSQTVTVQIANSLVIGEPVTIAGLATNGGCNGTDVADFDGLQTVQTVSATQFTFIVTAPNGLSNANHAGCNVTNATFTPGSNVLSPPAEDVGNTGNIFVGDSSANLYMLTPAGATAASPVSVGSLINGGVRSAPLVDSTDAVGFVVSGCDNSGTLKGGEADTTNAALWQVSFTSSTLTKVVGAELDTAGNEGCTTAGYPMYDPTADARYFVMGISSATEADNGELIAASSGTGGEQLKIFGFINSILQPAPLAKPQFEMVGPSPMSPLTEFWNTSTLNATVTAVTATTTTVTVTAANFLAANDMVSISGVSFNANCTAADAAIIDGPIQTVATATSTQFTFSAAIPTATSGSGCTVAGAIATGGPDYMFLGVEQNSPGVYSFLLPSGVVNNTITNVNAPDGEGGTSGIIVDNDSSEGQASSLYFGTLGNTSTTLCGGGNVYCAIKVTQGALQ